MWIGECGMCANRDPCSTETAVGGGKNPIPGAPARGKSDGATRGLRAAMSFCRCSGAGRRLVTMRMGLARGAGILVGPYRDRSL